MHDHPYRLTVELCLVCICGLIQGIVSPSKGCLCTCVALLLLVWSLCILLYTMPGHLADLLQAVVNSLHDSTVYTCLDHGNVK